MTNKNRTALYRFFADDDSLLYVGISRDPARRQAQHETNPVDDWWPLVARRTDEWFDARPAAEAAEVAAIVNERPRFNVKDNPELSPDVHRLRGERALRAEQLPSPGPFPRYYRVAQMIRQRIETGELPRGAAVPRAEYAREFGVSAETIKRACQELEYAGVLTQVKGIGYVTADDERDKGVVLVHVDRPQDAAAALRAAMTGQQLDALLAALMAAPAPGRPA